MTQAGLILLAVILALAGYGAYHLSLKANEALKRQKQLRAQEEEDESAYWEYEAKHKAIRAAYDPGSEWNEGTRLPAEYVHEIRALNLQYKSTLQRRNGWTLKDFEDSGI